MPRIIPDKPIPYTLPSNTLVIHREEAARWHVQCDRFAVHLAGEEPGLFERWAARLREHRPDVENTRRSAPGWLDDFLATAYPHAKPIVDGVVSEWGFVADRDYIEGTAKLGREEFERTRALGFLPPDLTYEAVVRTLDLPDAAP